MVTGSCLDAGHDVETSENIESMEVRNSEQLHSYTGIIIPWEVCRSERGEGGRMRTRRLGERERWHREEKHNVIIRPHCQTRGRYSPKDNFPNMCKDLRIRNHGMDTQDLEFKFFAKRVEKVM